MTTTRYNDAGVSPRVNIYAERKMLKVANPVMVLDKFGRTTQMPQNKSQNIKWRRPQVFTAADTPLQEGVTPTATQFRYEDVEATLRQYGMVVNITDVIEDTHEDPVINDAAEQAGKNIGRTIEKLTYGVVRAGTNVVRANGAARNQINTPVSLPKLRSAIRSLKRNKAEPITRMLESSVNYATRGIEAAYVAVCHTDLDSDIRNLPGFIPVAQYGSRKPVHDHEIGSVENIRFITSADLEPFTDLGGAYAGSGTAMVSTSGTYADVYPIMIFGEEAYGTVAIRGLGAVEPTIIRPGVKTKDDPLGQVGKVGWKTWFAAAILNQAWMVRLECSATAL